MAVDNSLIRQILLQGEGTPLTQLLANPDLGLTEHERRSLKARIEAAQKNGLSYQQAVDRATGYGVTSTPVSLAVEPVTPSFFEQLKKNLADYADALKKRTEVEGPADPNTTTVTPTAYTVVAYNDKFGDEPSADPLSQVELDRLVRFDEEKTKETDHPTFAIAVAVWIQGADVSKYLKGTVQIQKNSIQGHNTATLVLDNQNDQFVWTERNLASLYGRDFFFENGRQRLVTDQNRFLPDEKVKAKIFEQKGDPRINPPVLTARNTIVFPRYDLSPNRCVFARMDPIRIWSLYPFRPQGQENAQTRELWVPEFTGFIEHVSVEDDDLRGTSTMTIECADSRQMILQKMRVSTDPSTGMGNALDTIGFAPSGYLPRAGEENSQEAITRRQTREAVANVSGRFFNLKTTQFYDDVFGSEFTGQAFPNKNFQDSISELLVFKPERLRVASASRGVRNISLGGTFLYDSDWTEPRVARNFLSEYHKFCLFGPKRRPWTRSEVESVGRETKTYRVNADGDVEFGRYYPMNCRLWFLLPKEGTGPRSMADLGTVGIPSQHTINWTTRMEMLRNWVESLDYQMYVSATGDYHVEFPMADFRPEDFGEFKTVFRFNKARVNSGWGDEQSDPLAACSVHIGLGRGVATAPGEVAPEQLQTVHAFSPFIISRYGITVDSIQIPFLRSNEGDKAVAQQRAVIHMQKANARCHTLSMTTSYRPFLLPNRPVHHVRRTRIGSVVTLDTSFDLTSQARATVSVGCEHIRVWTGWYRKRSDSIPVSQIQQDELQEGGLETTKSLSIDEVLEDRPAQPGDAIRNWFELVTDPVALQVYQTVMGGESLPVGARYGWGAAAVRAPASGIYILDPAIIADQIPQALVASPPAHDVTAENVGDTSLAVPAKKPSSANRDTGNKVKFAKDPLAIMEVTSDFGIRNDPKNPKRLKNHKGLDLRARTPLDIYAVDDGVIQVVASTTGEAGKMIVLVPNDKNLRVEYLHLSSFAVTTGQTVKAGQVLGKSGNSSSINIDYHLHVQVKDTKTGDWIDPEPLMPGL